MTIENNDVMFEELSALASDIADLPAEQAVAYEAGAVAILGILRGSITDLGKHIVSSAVQSGASHEEVQEAIDAFNDVFEHLSATVDSRTAVVREAVHLAHRDNIDNETATSAPHHLVRAIGMHGEEHYAVDVETAAFRALEELIAMLSEVSDDEGEDMFA